jgi:hypothetical protein
MKHYFSVFCIGLLRWRFTHLCMLFATLQSHLITIISTCSLQISWKLQSPWVKKQMINSQSHPAGCSPKICVSSLFSAHLLFLTCTKHKASCCCDRCNTKFWFQILQTCYLGFWGNELRGKTRITWESLTCCLLLGVYGSMVETWNIIS